MSNGHGILNFKLPKYTLSDHFMTTVQTCRLDLLNASMIENIVCPVIYFTGSMSLLSSVKALKVKIILFFFNICI